MGNKLGQLLFFVILVLVTGAPLAFAVPPGKCSDALLGQDRVDHTFHLIAYLEQMLERRMIGDRELVRLIEGLKKDQWINPISKEQAKVDSALQIQREAIEEYFENTELDKTITLEWAEKTHKEKARVHVKRDEARIDTTDIYQKIEFHSVPHGSFLMGENSYKVKVKLTHPFEAMSTPVTQKQWVEIMGENPSHFVKGERTITVVVNGKSVSMQPDNPVENITWWSAVVFANRLSVKHGLRPVYDLSEVQFKDQTTRAESGTLEAVSGEVKINAPNGDIYLAEAYRLPTEAEQEYLLRAAGKAKGKYCFGDEEKDLKDHAWYRENAKESTQPVALKKPLIIEGKEFFDLHGNVYEWGNDRYAVDNLKLIGGENPPGLKSGSARVVRGGGWISLKQDLRSALRSTYTPSSRSNSIGLRLARTLCLENQNKKSTPKRGTK